MPIVTFADARRADDIREWLRKVYPLYLHDLSEFDATKYQLTAAGHWEPDYLPYWLDQPFCLPLVAFVDGPPVGFAFVGQAPFPFMSPSCDFRLCEFFVLRGHRRTGLGRSIALALFSQMRGVWGLVVLPRNTTAVQFWRVVLPLASTQLPDESSDAGGFHFVFSSRTT
jgi:predicted acetyltransferase